ncbi:MAG: hypothetical protein ACPKPY_06105 [Nitrososphaeraceae archaeon]
MSFCVLIIDKYVYSKVEDTLTLKYFNDRHNFIFSYPTNWSAIEFENDIKDKNLEIIASFISNQEAISDPFQEYINIKITNNIDYDSTSNYIDNYINDIQNDFKNIKDINIISNSSDVITLEYTIFPSGSLILKKFEQVVFKNQTVYHLEYTTIEQDYKIKHKLIQRIFDSFDVVK